MGSAPCPARVCGKHRQTATDNGLLRRVPSVSSLPGKNTTKFLIQGTISVTVAFGASCVAVGHVHARLWRNISSTVEQMGEKDAPETSSHSRNAREGKLTIFGSLNAQKNVCKCMQLSWCTQAYTLISFRTVNYQVFQVYDMSKISACTSPCTT